jgi:hypothetical protein
MEINGKLTEIDSDTHFSDAVTSGQDKLAGKQLGEVIGYIFPSCPYSESKQWEKVAKALRVGNS